VTSSGQVATPDSGGPEGSDPPARKGFSAGAWLASALGAVAATALVLFWGTSRYVRVYRLTTDDFALVMHSVSPYFSIRDWPSWFTEGYTHYFTNYPGWPPIGTSFARPAMNLAFYVEGFIARGLGEPAYLLASYVSVIATVLLLVGIVRRYSDATPGTAMLIALGVGLSPVWYISLVVGSAATNALALAFFVGSLYVLDPKRGVPRSWRLAAVLALQMLAVASHETAAVAPFVACALLFAYAPSRPRARELWPFLLPVVLLVVERLLLRSSNGVYAFELGGASELVARVKLFAIDPFVPYNSQAFLAARNALSPAAAFLYGLAILLNVVVFIALVSGFRSRPLDRSVAVIAAMAAAAAPGLLMLTDPRFMGFELVVSAVAVLFFTENQRGKWIRVAFVALLVASSMAMFVKSVVRPEQTLIAKAVSGGDFIDRTHAAIRQDQPTRIVLFNDMDGEYASLAMLQFCSWPQSGLSLVVVNSIESPADVAARASIIATGSNLIFEDHLGPTQAVAFDGAKPDFSLPQNGFSYSGLRYSTGTLSGFTATGSLSRGLTLVVGFDPRTGRGLTPVRILGAAKPVKP